MNGVASGVSSVKSNLPLPAGRGRGATSWGARDLPGRTGPRSVDVMVRLAFRCTWNLPVGRTGPLTTVLLCIAITASVIRAAIRRHAALNEHTRRATIRSGLADRMLFHRAGPAAVDDVRRPRRSARSRSSDLIAQEGQRHSRSSSNGETPLC